MDRFKINIKLATDLLMYYDYLGASTDDFQSGNFKSNHYEKTVELLNLVKDVFEGFDFAKDRHLIGAMIKIKDKGLCKFDVLKNKLKKAPHLIEQQLNVKSYIFYIEKVYNHGNHSREIII